MATTQAKLLEAKPEAKAPIESKSKTAPSHPPYAQLIMAAISSLKDRTGSSLPAIKKFISVKNLAGLKEFPSGWEKKVTVQLRKLVGSGKLHKVKGSFKVAEGVKPKTSKPHGVNPKTAVTKKAGTNPKSRNPVAPKASKPAAKNSQKPAASSELVARTPSLGKAAPAVKATASARAKAAITAAKPVLAAKKGASKKKSAKTAGKKPTAAKKVPTKKAGTAKKVTKAPKKEHGAKN